VLLTKIANVRMYSQPSETSKPVGAALARGEEVVVVGAEKDGFVNVQGAAGSGWIKVVLVTKLQ
jgi:hypothetical protein